MTRERDPFAEAFFVESAERNPLRAAANAARPPLAKRFYEKAEIAEVEGGFAILLDGKEVKTPARRALVLPAESLAEAIAAEWRSQGERLDPRTMPLTRLANTAIDGVAEHMAATEAEVVKYGGSDLVLYRASEPVALARAQSAAWDPLVAFAKDKLGADLVLAEGIVFVAQPEEALAAIARAARAHVGDDPTSPYRLAALYMMTTLTGSCLIALALASGEIDLDAAWAAAHVDEDFQMKAWGADAEARERRERRLVDMRAAAFVSRSLAVQTR